MNPDGLLNHISKRKPMLDEEIKDTLINCQTHIEKIRTDLRTIDFMGISDALKTLIVEELQNKIKDIKEEMHDNIDLIRLS